MPATAAVKTFSKFKLDVPDGWTTSETQGVAIVIAPNNAAALSIALDSTQGMSADALATEMSKALSGTTPQKEDNMFTFTFNQNGVTSTSIMVIGDGEYTMFTITDPTGNYDEAISKIISSAERN